MSEPANDDWADLLRRLESRQHRSGVSDSAAWEELTRRVRHFARMVLLSRPNFRPGDVEDVAQNVLLKFQSVQTMKRVRSAASAKGYVWVIVRNAAADLARGRQQEPDSLKRSAPDVPFGAVTGIREGVDKRTAHLNDELRLLSSEEQSLIEMRFWRNLSIAEIAAELRLSYSAVAVRLFRLIKRLRERLDEPQSR